MRSELLVALEKFPHRRAVEAHDATLSYAALHKEARRVADALQGAGTVALLMDNSAAWVVADLACLIAGVTCVAVPPFFTQEQLTHVLADAGVTQVITQQPRRIEGVAKPFIIAGQDYSLVRTLVPPKKLPAGIAKITYTSGTTGAPKGVCLRQEALEQVASSILQTIGTTLASRHVCLLPLAVLLENVAGLYTALLAGATVMLPRIELSPAGLAQALIGTNATSCILMPEMLRMLMSSGRTFPALRFAAVGGAKVSPQMVVAAQGMGIPVYEGYGLSECASVVALNTANCHCHGSVGMPLPHVLVRIALDGEILIKDPLFTGYLGQPPFPGGWYATGDKGRLDSKGFLYVEGRKKNIFITSFGRNISPEWPESLLVAHPAIAQAAVFGEAQPYSVAVIVARDPLRIAEALAEVNAGLPDYAHIGGYVRAGEAFTPANGLLTDNGRVKRASIYQRYRAEIQSIYGSNREKTA